MSVARVPHIQSHILAFLFGLSLSVGLTFCAIDNSGQGAEEDAATEGGSVPAGTVLVWAGDTAPEGFLLCDGAEVNRETYADLFDAIGTAWGEGDGSSTFRLPDLRGRFLRGVDGGAGVDPDAGSRAANATRGNSGDAVGSEQTDELRSHTHTLNFAQQNVSGGTGGAITVFSSSTSQTLATGGNETRPVNAYVNYVIKH